MEIEPKEVSIEDLKDSFKEAFNFIRTHLFVYFIMWLLLNLNVYLSTAEPYWLLVSPLFFGVLFVGVFEMTCTLFVGYNGSLYQKMVVSLKAAWRTLLLLVLNHPFIMGFYFLIFYSILLRAVLTPNDINDYTFLALKSLSWTGLFITGFFNLYSVLRLGCISMFLSNPKDYALINILIIKARQKSLNVYFKSSMVGFMILMLAMVTREVFSSFLLMYTIVVGFFFFQKVFEPPMLKKAQEKEIENTNAVPEAT